MNRVTLNSMWIFNSLLVMLLLMPQMLIALELNPSFAPESVAQYKAKADAGDAEAQYLYSRALMNGTGAWFLKGCDFKWKVVYE